MKFIIDEKAYDLTQLQDDSALRNLILVAIASLPINNRYSDIIYHGRKIHIDPAIFIRASDDILGERTIEADGEELGTGNFGVVNLLDRVHLEEQQVDQHTVKGAVIKTLKRPKEYDSWAADKQKSTMDREREKLREESLLTQSVYKQTILGENEVVLPNLGQEIEKHFTCNQETLDRTMPDMAQRFILCQRFLDSLASIHAKRIVHQDLKTKNMCLEQVDGVTRVNVFDFGVSAKTGASCRRMRDKNYGAPEQGGVHDATCQTDIYAAGFVFLELICSMRTIRDKGIRANLLREDSGKVESAVKALLDDAINPNMKHARAILYTIFKMTTNPIADERPDLSTLQFMTKLLSLSKNEFKFLKGDTTITLNPDEKIHLKVILSSAAKNKPYADALSKIVRFKPLEKLSIDIDSSAMVEKLSYLSPIERHIIGQVFHEPLRSLNVKASHDLPIPDIIEPLYFIKNYDVILNNIHKCSDMLNDKYAMSYQDSAVAKHMHELSHDIMMRIPNESDRLTFFRHLPRAARDSIRDELFKRQDPSLPLYLPGFHLNIDDTKEARKLHKGKPNNHFAIFKIDEKFKISFVDESGKAHLKTFSFTDGKLYRGDMSFKSISDFYHDVLTETDGQHIAPIIEKRRDLATWELQSDVFEVHLNAPPPTSDASSQAPLRKLIAEAKAELQPTIPAPIPSTSSYDALRTLVAEAKADAQAPTPPSTPDTSSQDPLRKSVTKAKTDATKRTRSTEVSPRDGEGSKKVKADHDEPSKPTHRSRRQP